MLTTTIRRWYALAAALLCAAVLTIFLAHDGALVISATLAGGEILAKYREDES